MQGNTCFACDWLLSLVLPDLILSGLTVTASSLAVNDTLYPPAGWCKLAVSVMISIDESSLGESVSRGCSLVAQPPPLAVPDWCLGCLTFPAAP